jgi:hypothetical protein
LFPLVYDELKRIAHAKLSFEPERHTLNTTALVHEAYLKLVGRPRSRGRANPTSSRSPCGITRDGLAYCWGLNSGGELGDGTQTRRNVPAMVARPLAEKWAWLRGRVERVMVSCIAIGRIQ